MLYPVAGDPKIGYDLRVGTGRPVGTYGGYVAWYGYGYGTGVRYGGANSATFGK